MSKYNYAEAFCLMEYWCCACKTREIIWNSRDGLTPFQIRCRQCGNTMVHRDFRSDVCIPNYVPFKGNRIFVGCTEWPVLVTFGEESLQERRKILENTKEPHKTSNGETLVKAKDKEEVFEEGGDRNWK